MGAWLYFGLELCLSGNDALVVYRIAQLIVSSGESLYPEGVHTVALMKPWELTDRDHNKKPPLRYGHRKGRLFIPLLVYHRCISWCTSWYFHLGILPKQSLYYGKLPMKWWRWRESNPRPKTFHVKRLHA